MNNIDKAIQQFSEYARGKGNFDELDLKEVIYDYFDNRNINRSVSDVTRVEVIDDTGRSYTAHNVSVSLDLQDDSRTLKVFVKREGSRK